MIGGTGRRGRGGRWSGRGIVCIPIPEPGFRLRLVEGRLVRIIRVRRRGARARRDGPDKGGHGRYRGRRIRRGRGRLRGRARGKGFGFQGGLGFWPGRSRGKGFDLLRGLGFWLRGARGKGFGFQGGFDSGFFGNRFGLLGMGSARGGSRLAGLGAFWRGFDAGRRRDDGRRIRLGNRRARGKGGGDGRRRVVFVLHDRRGETGGRRLVGFDRRDPSPGRGGIRRSEDGRRMSALGLIEFGSF